MNRLASNLTRFAAAAAFVLVMVALAGCSQRTCSTCTQSATTASCPPGCTKPCCAKPAVTTTAAYNSKCPFSGKPVDPTVTVAYGDKTVAFCCPGCIGRWDKLADADKDAKLAAAK